MPYLCVDKRSALTFAMRIFLTIISLLVAANLVASPVATDTTHIEIIDNESVEVVATMSQIKQQGLFENSVAATKIFMQDAEREKIDDMRSMSSYAPNFFVPDYGSRMTSSIYMRGMGARIDQPAVGLYVDDVPVLNKNAFDFDVLDIRSIKLMRGPQSTLYGRNTMAGVMDVRTLSPIDYEYTRLMAEYATANSIKVNASHYERFGEDFGVSLGGYYRHSDGMLINEYNDRSLDWENGGGGRAKFEWRKKALTLTNTFSADAVNQGGWPYRLIGENGEKLPTNYNDPSNYTRLSLSDAVRVVYMGEKYALTSVTSWSYLNDCMTLDQDFTPRSMFTLQQAQREHTLTEEVVVKYDPTQRYSARFGLFGFYKHLNMSAPVRFKRDGIEELILANANKGLQTMFPNHAILFEEDEFDITSDFLNPTWGAALFHTSEVRLGRWTLGAGVRFDYEHTTLKYDSRATIHYRFTMTMPQFKELQSTFVGKNRKSFFEVLPRISANYRSVNNKLSLYATISKGYKAGGFNTQIFSDILQNRMMTDLMADLGVYLDQSGPSYDTAEATGYKPEHSWNYELGASYTPTPKFSVEGTLFYIDCRDQQLTVFPAGKSTGRMMTNAGRTRSYGVEATVDWCPAKNLDLRAAYGYTNARFIEYNDGRNDYRGCYVPYAPQHTLSLSGDYTWHINRTLQRVRLHADWRGAGRIYWNEANAFSQPFYGLLGASIALDFARWTIEAWGRNLTGTEYDTFYFVSVGNAFMQSGRPRQLGVKLSFEF